MTSISMDVNKEADTNKVDGCKHENRNEVQNIENKIESFMTEEQEENISPFREVLPQFIANSLMNLLALDQSLITNYTTVLIADLHRSEGDMSLDDNMASWIASMAYIWQPMGSICSGIMVEKLGRKGGLLMVNVPYLIAWLLICTAPNVTILLVANFVIGVSVGLTEAPLINYAGEMAQPHIRGTITATGGIFYSIGMFMSFLIGALTSWRTTAAICCAVPVISFFLILLLPETPPYLVSKGRIKDAEKSLCWLRGWVKPSHVQEELKDLIKNHEASNLTQDRKSPDAPVHEVNLLLNEKMEHRQDNLFKRAINSLLELFEPHTLRPLMVVIPFFVSGNLTGVTSTRPYLVHVFTELKQAMDPRWATVLISVSNLVACITLMVTVKMMGKRRISILYTGVCAVLSLMLGTYAFFLREDSEGSWIPIVLFVPLSFATAIIYQIPWMIMCEVFPFRTRGLASGISAAFLYLIIFTVSNTYLSMEKAVGIYGSFWVFSAVNFAIIVYLYYTLPETEGKSLQDIERHFRKGLFIKSDNFNCM